MYTAVGSVCALMMPSTLRADVITLAPVQDATLLGGTDASGSTNNSEANPGIYVGTDGQGNPKRGLIEFNVAPPVSGIPAGSTITGVDLELYMGNVAGGGGGSGNGQTASETISLYDETQAWGKVTKNVTNTSSLSMNGHGKPADPGDVTWNYAAYNTTAWNTLAGGNLTTNSASIAGITVGTNLGHYDWPSASNPAMVADVQNWLNNPSSNNGWLLVSGDETDAGTFRAFYSQEGSVSASNSAFAPVLTVTYTPVPEPSGISLVAVGMPILLRRRSRNRGRVDHFR
jgi:hypothetical protein